MADFVRAAYETDPDVAIRPEFRDCIAVAQAAGIRLAIPLNDLDLVYGANVRTKLPILSQLEGNVEATYSGHPVGAAAALACLAEAERLRVHDNAAARGAELFAGLHARQRKHEVIGDIRCGHGLTCALELVSVRAKKTPIDKKSIGEVQEVAYGADAMVRVSGPNIFMSAPLVLTSANMQVILSALDEGIAVL